VRRLPKLLVFDLEDDLTDALPQRSVDVRVLVLECDEIAQAL
jgi:hypothetical protein